MLIAEAARAAGLEGDGRAQGRPTCAIIPAVLRSQRAVLSLSCVGNRVYTELPSSETYCAVPGLALEQLLEKLEIVMLANRALEEFHRSR